MSTNFYMFDLQRCEERHLGQRAGGWRFQFRAYPELGVTEIQGWLRQIDKAAVLYDEYMRRYTPDELLEAVEACGDGRPRDLYGNDWYDQDGNAFSASHFS